MALNRRAHSKSAKERRNIHEHSQRYNSDKGREFLIGNYLESMSNADKRLDSKTSNNTTKKSGMKLKVRDFASQPSPYDARPQNHAGKVANRSLRDIGAYAWTPLATRTAVGYGDNIYVESMSSMKKPIRPESAPNIRMRRSRSVNSMDTMSSSFAASLVTSHASVRKKSKKGYMEEPITLCVRAFPNGSREKSVRVTSKTLAQLLEEATEKLDLPSAGRRIFLPDGTLVTFAHQLYKDCNVYISMGEPFRDPYEVLRDNERTRLSSSWTITGILLPEDRTNAKKTKLSKRMKSLLESPKHRVLAFKNGVSHGGAEVLTNRFDELLNDCTRKLDLTSSARTLYAWNGGEVQSFLELSKVSSDDLIPTPQHGGYLGPVWVSRGEPFNPKGAYNYFMAIAIDLKQRIKKSKESLENLQKQLDDGEKNVAEEQKSKVDIENEIRESKSNITSMKATLKEVRSRLDVIKANSESEVPPEIIDNKRLDNTKGYRLKLLLNGSECSSAVTLAFSSKDLRKGKATKEETLRSFFDLLNNNQSLKECFIGHGRRAEFKRAFLVNGAEINDVNDISNDAEVWLSLGEDFVPIEYQVVGLTTDQVKCTNYWGEKTICQRQSWLGADEKLAKSSLWDVITSVPMDSMKKVSITESFPEDQKQMFVTSMNNERVRNDGVFLQSKKEPGLVLYPELQLIRKRRGQDVTFWGEDAKQWILSQDGTIINKFFKNMALSVGDQELSIRQDDQVVKGYAVGLALKKAFAVPSNETRDGEQGTRFHIDPHQEWKLTPDGQIVSAMLPNLYLTSISDLRVEKMQDAKVNEDEPIAKMSSLSSSSDSSDSDSSLKLGEDCSDKVKAKKMKKRKKKDKKKKEKKKWWNFGSSSSSDSSDEDDLSRERKKSCENIKVRMKGTSSEDDKIEIKSEQEQSGAAEGDSKAEGNNGEEVVKTANDLLKEMPEVYGGESILLGVFDKFEDKDPLKIRQRWAVKTENAGSLLSSATLSDKWTRQELTWPVNEGNSWVESSLIGCLLPCAPKLKRKIQNKEKSSSPFYGQPARLKVLRNGEHESSRAVTVIGPDLSNMTRRVQASLPLKWKKSKRGFQDIQGASVAEVEFEQFLDKCTDSLQLPFAARRLFDEKGKELTSVNTLERDQLVYVSCGENWVDPHVTYSEQQRRLLLANLASDVCKIRNYVTLRDQSDLILHVDGPLQADSRLVLRKRPMDSDLNNNDDTESTSSENQTMQEKEIRELQSSYLNAHQISHIKSEERLQDIRERLLYNIGMVSNISTMDDTEDDSPFSNPSLARKFSPSAEPVSKPPQNAFRQWLYHDGFIQLKANKKLVIGVQENGDESTSGQDVIICNKKLEDSLQRWVISDQGFIYLKCNSQLVLTVATPVLQTDSFSESNHANGYAESRIILGRRHDCYNGNSHQMFDIESDTGYINAFSTDPANKEVTAAAKASVCTYSIFGSREIYQPGYSISEGTKPNSGPARVCESCGKAVRGKLKLQKIKDIVAFACAMGTPEKYGLATSGSFKCLSSQIDLSQREAESTLLAWEGQLRRLQKESSVKVISYELNLARTTPSVRILAHKNGDIGYSDGVTVIANSINQFLDLCTYKLGLTQAARKLFTMDGELIIDMNQLLQPYYPELCSPLIRSTIHDEKKSSSSEENNKTDSDKLTTTTAKQASDLTSEASDATFSLPYRDEIPPKESVNPQKRVAFADTRVENEVEEIPNFEKMDVRIPVDVWVSCGEPFIPFEDSERLAVRTCQDREERAGVADYLEQEKHLLRQLQGHRYAGRGSAQGNDTAVRPVLMKVWDQPSKQEEVLEKSIGDLQLHLSELKCQQDQERRTEVKNSRPMSAKIFDRMKESKLYDLPRSINVLVYPNGEHLSRALGVVVSSMTELLDKATSRLDLNSVARRAFTKDGDEILDFNEIEKNQVVCVTCGEKFVPHRERRQNIEMRASWSRSHKGNNHTTTTRHSSTTALALAAPPSPARNSPLIRKPKHEETLHMFEENNRAVQSPILYTTSSQSSPPRPMSARPNSKKPVAAHRSSSGPNSPLRTTDLTNFDRSKSATSGRTKLWKHSNSNSSDVDAGRTPKRPISAHPTSARGISARPTSDRIANLSPNNVKATTVES